MNVFDLWLPILLSGLATHIYSTLAWIVLPHHKPEWLRLPQEDAFQDFVVQHSIPPGQYLFPLSRDSAEISSEGFQEKQKKCNGMLVLWAQPVRMGSAIAKTLLFFFVAAFVIAYLASLGLPPGSPFSKVVQFVTTAGLLTHCAAKFPNAFWFRRKVAMDIVDGVVFAFITGFIFAFLWPAA